MFDINGTLPLFVLSFLVYMWLLNKVMIQPVSQAIERRAAKIKGDLDAGKASRAQAQQVLEEYEKHLHGVRAEAQGVINEAAEKATYHRNIELTKVRDEGRKKVEEAKAVIGVERSSLMEGLVQQEIELVRNITEKLTGEKSTVNLDPIKVRRALEEAS